VLPELLKEHRANLGGEPVLPAQIVVGRSDRDLMPTVVTLDAKPHFIVTGPPSSGKSTTLHTWILSLAEFYTPQEIGIVMVDYQGGIVDYGGEHKLDELPHALMPVITEPQQFGEMVKAVVDIEQGIMAIGGELHSDEEAVLLDQGSAQRHLWGINLYPDKPLGEWIEFDSMINVRPSGGNRSRYVENSDIREAVTRIVNRLVGGLPT